MRTTFLGMKRYIKKNTYELKQILNNEIRWYKDRTFSTHEMKYIDFPDFWKYNHCIKGSKELLEKRLNELKKEKKSKILESLGVSSLIGGASLSCHFISNYLFSRLVDQYGSRYVAKHIGDTRIMDSFQAIAILILFPLAAQVTNSFIKVGYVNKAIKDWKAIYNGSSELDDYLKDIPKKVNYVKRNAIRLLKQFSSYDKENKKHVLKENYKIICKDINENFKSLPEPVRESVLGYLDKKITKEFLTPKKMVSVSAGCVFIKDKKAVDCLGFDIIEFDKKYKLICDG